MISASTDFERADCTQKNQLQPLLAGLFSSSVPPAPEVLPLQALWELPASGFSPLQALFAAQPLKVREAPDIRPAMHRPASIFFRSFASIKPPVW
jgi:hypothetical protein